MNFDFIVLGATGLQGRIVAKDLLKNNYSVLLCGRNKKKVLNILKKYKKSKFKYIEAKNLKTIFSAIKLSKSNVVINCIEGNWNFEILKESIKANVNYIDLGSEIPITKKQLKLDQVLKNKKLISITGIGSVPGIGNIMLKYVSEKLDQIYNIDVGFTWSSNLKKFVVPFSIESIIEEFTEPAPIVKNGHFIKKNPLNSIIERKHRYIDKGKEFFVRHPEQYTFYHYFKNKGVKNIRFYAGFPEHSFNVIKTLIDIGMGSKKEINYNGLKIKPILFLTEVLKHLKIPDGYKEKENLWVKVTGKKNGKKKEILMECIVPTIKGWEDSGCNIDTGMPASILAQMIKKKIITEKGSFSPEGVVPTKLFFKELKKRNMRVLENGKLIN